MKTIIDLIVKFLQLLFPFKTQDIKPVPPPKPVQGLLSMNLHTNGLVGKLFDNPMLIGALQGTVDLQKQFKLGFPCVLHCNSDQKFSIQLVEDSIVLRFNDTHPKLEAQKIFDIKVDIDFVQINRKQIRISLVGLPDYYVKFVD